MDTKEVSIKRELELLALMFSVVVGSLNLGIVLWKGGALVKEHEQVLERVKALETAGSRIAAEHIKLDDMREQMVNERIVKLETIAAIIQPMAADVVVIKERVVELRQSLEEHKNAVKP